jgi:hypothetical protein
VENQEYQQVILLSLVVVEVVIMLAVAEVVVEFYILHQLHFQPQVRTP